MESFREEWSVWDFLAFESMIGSWMAWKDVEIFIFWWKVRILVKMTEGKETVKCRKGPQGGKFWVRVSKFLLWKLSSSDVVKVRNLIDTSLIQITEILGLFTNDVYGKNFMKI